MADRSFRSSNNKVRVGKITVEELLNGSGSSRPMFSQLPPGFPSLTSHHPTPYVPQNYLQPEILLAAMAAAQQAVNVRSPKKSNYSPEANPMSTTYSCPNCTYSLNMNSLSISPLAQYKRNTMTTSSQMSFQDKRPRFSPQNLTMNEICALPNSPSNLQLQRSGQKSRKPYFMPYISYEAVNRGLKSGDLIKGTLRVNQRNYEESYIDNPDGDEQQDVLILGVHDRNRALHGDIVVLRLKERNEWVVRDALYYAWRTGHLNMLSDDNGQPISVPPIKSPAIPAKASKLKAEVFQLFPGLCDEKDIEKIDVPVAVPKNNRYSKDALLQLGAQVALHQHVDLDESVSKLIQSLSIDRTTIGAAGAIDRNGNSSNKMVSTPTLPSNVRRSGSGNTVQRRLNYRLLSDMPDEDWGIPDICLQKTAEVVYIAEQKNTRAAVGQLKVMADGNRNWSLFSPIDSRMPRMMIPADQLPNGFFERPQDFSKFIFIASIVEWPATAQFARGKLYKCLGQAGEIDAETEGLLIANAVDTREFSHSALKSLLFTELETETGETLDWKIEEKEFKYRKDFRQYTIFTIDPVTARDLDDALHITRLADCDGHGNPGWEVGVHIADVSYFLLMNTELDSWAAARGNSVYLVHKVIPMLPKILSEELCSLNPNKERLTFSVVWKMNDNAEIKDTWFGRSIIRSCAQLAYEHAQEIIDHMDEAEYEFKGFPGIFNGKNFSEVRDAVLNLHKLATKLNKQRVENGALRLDRPKMKFSLNNNVDITGLPNELAGLPHAVALEERKESNRLVEEFMLLANIAVAERIAKHYPKIGLLRRHPRPKQKALREVIEKCNRLNIPISGISSKQIAMSLQEHAQNPKLKELSPVLVHFFLRAMSLAQYFCTATKSDYSHYALNVDFYTHFTSPIRRYPDVIVHRLLAASLGYIPPPGYNQQQIESIAEHCNDKKLTAKNVFEANSEMFFGLLVNHAGRMDTKGVVVAVLDSAFDVLLIEYGLIKRVYTNRLKLAREPRFIEGLLSMLKLYWDPSALVNASSTSNSSSSEAIKTNDSGSKSSESVADKKKNNNNKIEKNDVFEQTIQLLSFVDVILTSAQEPSKFNAVIRPCPDNSSTVYAEPTTSDKMRLLVFNEASNYN